MEGLIQVFSELWTVWIEMLGILFEIVKRVFFFLLWIICGVLILPCVYVAGVFFPMWTDWGEKNF